MQYNAFLLNSEKQHLELVNLDVYKISKNFGQTKLIASLWLWC